MNKWGTQSGLGLPEIDQTNKQKKEKKKFYVGMGYIKEQWLTDSDRSQIGVRCSSVVEHQLVVQWIVGSMYPSDEVSAVGVASHWINLSSHFLI